MTVSTLINRMDPVGNGTAGPFPYTFKIFSTSHLYVYVSGILKILNTHYTVSGVGVPTGGNVTFTAGNFPAVGVPILIIRIVPLSQLSDYVNHSSFDAEVLEMDLDKVIMMAQQFNEGVARIFKIALTETISGVTVPVVAGKALRWNAAGDNIELYTIDDADCLNVITTQGDVIIGGAGGIASRLGIGTAKQVLKSQGAGANPIWGNEADITLTTRGDILYRNATVLARLPAGTSGQVLKTKGAAADPVWGEGARRLIFPASCFESRVGAGWATFTQVQGVNFDYGTLDFDATTNEKANTPAFRLTNWDGGDITIRIAWKANAIVNDVFWIVSFVGIADGEPFDAAMSDHNFAVDTVSDVAEDINIVSLTLTPAELANNDTIIMKITRHADDATDTLVVDAKILYVELEFNEA